MIKFTLDTNCIIALDESRPAAGAVRQLISLHRDGQCVVALAAMSASERQRGDRYIESYKEFTSRLTILGLSDLPIIPGMAYWGISYWGHGLWASEEMAAREAAIHAIVFPKIPFKLSDVERSESGEASRQAYKRWRNAFCDRQMFWAHDYAGHDVFVKSDGDFRPLERHLEFPNACIRKPDEALALVRDARDRNHAHG